MISAVVCTYNRAELLRQLLETLARHAEPGVPSEIIAVDNNSTDPTRSVVRSFEDRIPGLRYVHERRQGLSHARNRGWREARGTYVAYLDDDCKTPPHYFSVARKIAETIAPAVYGGPVLPYYAAPKPRWFKDSYVAYELTPEARALTEEEFIFGGNMIVRRAIIERLGGFSPELGMCGDTIGYGEEIVPQQAIRERLPAELIYYDPRLYIHHLTRPEKMTLRWGLKNAFAHGVYLDRIFHGLDEPPSRSDLRSRMLRTAAALGKDLVRAWVTRDREKYPHVQNYIYEHSFRHVMDLGRLREKYRKSGKDS